MTPTGNAFFTAGVPSVLLTGATFSLILLLCLAGILMSMLSLSGSWLVVLAAVIATTLGRSFPSLTVVLCFIAVAIILEIVECFAGAWGVTRRGGSRAGGVAAVVGSLAGLCLGTFIPVPVIGSLLGMLLGGFGLVFMVEWNRLQRHGAAAHIAWGSVLARIAMIFLKVCATIGMSVVLIIGSFSA
ncbi:MAG: DUF456 domain-containing protein [Verrucomicrobia bacterium]|nr:DUF456 domain-containing protein [Verrucomicrobiota bacterium]